VDDQGAHSGTAGADVDVAFSHARVLAPIEPQTKKAEAVDRRPAHLMRVLPDPSREHERIHAAQRRRHRGDQRPQAVHVDVEGELRPRIALASRLQHAAHVAAGGQRLQP